jgi:hypothetical protein
MGMRAKNRAADFGATIYTEKMIWPIWLWSFLIFMFASLSLALWAAAGNTAAAVLTIAELLLLIILERRTGLKVTVTKGWLIVGRAAIPRAHIHGFAPLSPAEMKRARGKDFDPAAFLDIRFWVKGGVKIMQRDPKDPTPYWLISSKAPEDLVRVLDLRSIADH